MYKKLIFSFSGLKGNITNKFDFNTTFKVIDSDNEYDIFPLGDNENGYEIETTDIESNFNIVNIEVIQEKQNHTSTTSFLVELGKTVEQVIVTIDKDNNILSLGAIQQFNVQIIGFDGISQDVIWEIDEDDALSTIDQYGVLKIDINETLESLTIRATSVFDNSKSGSISIVIKKEEISVDPQDYLKMFVSIPGQSTYVNPTTVTSDPLYTHHWYNIWNETEYQLEMGGTTINKNWLLGLRQIAPHSQIASAPLQNNHNIYIFKLWQDKVINKISLPQLENDTDDALNYLQNEIGISSSLDRLAIYLTYLIGVPIFFFNNYLTTWQEDSYNGNLNNSFKYLQQFLDTKLTYTCNWINWENLTGSWANAAGVCWAYSPPYGTFSSVITMDPAAGSWRWTSNNSPSKPNQWRRVSGTNNVQMWTLVKGSSDPFETNYKLPWITDESEIVSTLIHELGHSIDAYGAKITPNGLRLSAQSEWLDLWWTTKGSQVSADRWQNGFVYDFRSEFVSSTLEPPPSDYGSTVNVEDFAESYARYCINPNYLQQEYPKRYAFLNKWLPQLQQ